MNIKVQTLLTWRLVVKCHNLNKSICKGVAPTKEEERLYKQKGQLLDTIVARIKKYQLPIHYGWEESGSWYVPYILYFEYQGTQLSFHCHHKHGATKTFPEGWDGERKGFVTLNGRLVGNHDNQIKGLNKVTNEI